MRPHARYRPRVSRYVCEYYFTVTNAVAPTVVIVVVVIVKS